MDMEFAILYGLILFLILIIIFLFYKYSKLMGGIEDRARIIFEQWRGTELQSLSEEKAKILFEGWKQAEEASIRQDAIDKSTSTIKGKVTEHILPYFPEFKYNPKDVRFIGSPVDLLVFDGMNEGILRKIIFVEIKTGKSRSFTSNERQVKQFCMENGIPYELIYQDSRTEEFKTFPYSLDKK